MRKKPELSLRARALQYLARRDYSRAELRGKLLPHIQIETEVELEHTAELDKLLDDFSARGWVSDARAAAQLIHLKSPRFGVQRITHELRQKGIPDEVIEEAIPQLKENELQAALDVWQKKFGHLPLDQKEKARQIRFMQSRGFSTDVIVRLLRMSELDSD